MYVHKHVCSYTIVYTVYHWFRYLLTVDIRMASIVAAILSRTEMHDDRCFVLCSVDNTRFYNLPICA